MKTDIRVGTPPVGSKAMALRDPDTVAYAHGTTLWVESEEVAEQLAQRNAERAAGALSERDQRIIEKQERAEKRIDDRNLRREARSRGEALEPYRHPDGGFVATDLLDEVEDGIEDEAQGRYLAEKVKGKALFDPSKRTWHLYDPVTGIWLPDDADNGRIMRLAFNAVTRDLAVRGPNNDTGRLRKLLNVGNMERALKALSTIPSFRCDEWDTDANLIAFTNGVVDISDPDLTLRPAAPEDRITRHMAGDYVPDAAAPKTEAAFLEICSGDRDLADYLWRWFGYSITGYTTEQKFLIMTGGGRNGKGVICDTVRDAAGTYGDEPNSLLYMRNRQGNGDSAAPNTSLVNLEGVRLTTFSEPPGGVFNEERLKAHTGDDSIEARDLYVGARGVRKFKPTHSITFRANGAPAVEDLGPSIEDRVRVADFRERYSDPDRKGRLPEGVRKKDQGLVVRLRRERLGIIARLVREARAWYVLVHEQDASTGLPQSKRIEDASRAYLTGQNPMAGFVAARCAIEHGTTVERRRLMVEYADWCRDTGEEQVNGTAAGTGLRNLGVELDAGKRNYLGIRLLNAVERADSDDGDDG